MKKSYKKPLVYWENNETGVVMSNSEAYKQEIGQKLAVMKDMKKIELSGEKKLDASNISGVTESLEENNSLMSSSISS